MSLWSTWWIALSSRVEEVDQSSVSSLYYLYNNSYNSETCWSHRSQLPMLKMNNSIQSSLSWEATPFALWKWPQKAGGLKLEVAFVLNYQKMFWSSDLKTEWPLIAGAFQDRFSCNYFTFSLVDMLDETKILSRYVFHSVIFYIKICNQYIWQKQTALCKPF